MRKMTLGIGSKCLGEKPEHSTSISADSPLDNPSRWLCSLQGIGGNAIARVARSPGLSGLLLREQGIFNVLAFLLGVFS